MILAGDIGGTKTILALYDKKSKGELQCKQKQTFISADYKEFNDILSLFIHADFVIESACFGIAGPIINQRCHTTNLPWMIDAQDLSIQLKTSHIKLLNDLEAMALGMLYSKPDDLIDLNPSAIQNKQANIAVIAAGTGLGQAILFWDGKKYHPIATEGGHCDFATQTIQQDQFLSYLRQQIGGHISWERVLSGNGFGYLYDFLIDTKFAPACPDIPSVDSLEDRNALISKKGINQEDPICIEVVRLFTELYAAEAGNLALKCLATGGVFIGGGIGPKIRPALESEHFLRTFSAKGRFQKLLSTIPIKLSLNPEIALLGAANYFLDQ